MNFNTAFTLAALFASTASCAFSLTCETTSGEVAERFRKDTQLFLENAKEIWGCGRKYRYLNDDRWMYNFCIERLELPRNYNLVVMNLEPSNFSYENFPETMNFCAYSACYNLNRNFNSADFEPSKIMVTGGTFDPNCEAPDFTYQEIMDYRVRKGTLRRIRVPGSPDDNPEYEYEKVEEKW